MNNCECTTDTGCGATYNFYSCCKCDSDENEVGSGTNIDLIFEGYADISGSYNLTASISEYSAIVVEIGMYHYEWKTMSRQYEYIPLPEISDQNGYYSHFAHMFSGGRYNIVWHFSSVETLVMDSSLKENSTYNIGITRIYGIK